MITLDMICSHDPAFPWNEYHKLWQSREIFDAQVEDGYPPPEEITFITEPADDCWIFMASSEGKYCGFTVIEQLSLYWGEIHASFLRKTPGSMKKLAGIWTLKAAFDGYNFVKMSAFIAAYNRPARLYAREIGMEPEGRITKSFVRNGQLVDRIVYGVTKDEFSLRFGPVGQ